MVISMIIKFCFNLSVVYLCCGCVWVVHIYVARALRCHEVVMCRLHVFYVISYLLWLSVNGSSLYVLVLIVIVVRKLPPFKKMIRVYEKSWIKSQVEETKSWIYVNICFISYHIKFTHNTTLEHMQTTYISNKSKCVWRYRQVQHVYT